MARSQSQKTVLYAALIVVALSAFFASEIRAHTNHSHTTEPSPLESVEEISEESQNSKDSESKTVTTTEAKEKESLTLPTDPVTTAGAVKRGFVSLDEGLFGLIVAAPLLLITLKNRLRSR
ncbi:MAG: hypothetical protein AAFN40_27825 [Cyanobacteria bacterium J06560_6]